MLVYYFVPFIVSNRYLLFWVSNGRNSVTVQNRTHVYMNFYDHKDLGNHLLQLCPKVVKHPVFWIWLMHGRWNTLTSFVLLLVRMVPRCYVHGCLLQVWTWTYESCLSMSNLSRTHTMQHSQLNLSQVRIQCGLYCHIYQTPVVWNWLAVFSTAVCLHYRTGWMP